VQFRSNEFLFFCEVDNVSKADGSLVDDFDFLGPKEIKDPDQSKPSDWVCEKQNF
jgi:calreticulin